MFEITNDELMGRSSRLKLFKRHEHNTAFVNDGIYLLRFFILVLIHHQLTLAPVAFQLMLR